MGNTYWGIDLGGTKIEGVVLNTTRDVLFRHRIPTEQSGGYEHIIARIIELIHVLGQETGLLPESVGIGTPGTTDPSTGLLKNSNTVVLNGKPFHADLQEALGIPVFMANDANCFAFAETVMGSVQSEMPEAKTVFGVIMGTGVGGGVVIDGQLLTGAQGIGGEWGHMHLDDSGGTCYCGRTGCVETIISGPALERFYAGRSGTQLKLKEIVSRHLLGSDAEASATIERLLHFFGRGLGNVINILDPDVIVLGGGLGNIDLLYTEGIDRVAQNVFNDQLGTRFLRPSLGDSAGVFGAAMLVR